MVNKIKDLKEFQTIIESEKPVIIKFFTDWCPDCKRMDVFLPYVLENVKSRSIYEINRDQFPELAQKYDVMGIPSLLIFQTGKKIAHLHSANAKTEEQVTNFLNKSLL